MWGLGCRMSPCRTTIRSFQAGGGDVRVLRTNHLWVMLGPRITQRRGYYSRDKSTICLETNRHLSRDKITSGLCLDLGNCSLQKRSTQALQHVSRKALYVTCLAGATHRGPMSTVERLKAKMGPLLTQAAVEIRSASAA